MYHTGEFYIPDRMMGGILRYIEHGVRPGDFLQAVICDSLSDATITADDENLRNLPAFGYYFYMEVPTGLRGKENMEAWIKVKQEKREEKENADKERSQDEHAPRQEV